MDTTRLPRRFHAIPDPDDARDAAEDYLADAERQYEEYVEECHADGVRPLPFRVTLP